jgi:hypothetical protein
VDEVVVEDHMDRLGVAIALEQRPQKVEEESEKVT